MPDISVKTFSVETFSVKIFGENSRWKFSVKIFGENFRWKFSVKILGEIKILEVKFDPPHKWKFMFQISYK